MKILSLNLHCYAEKEIKRNQKLIAEFIYKNDIDVVFLQEVAQTHDAKIVQPNIKEDNYGYILKTLLSDLGKEYDYHYMYGNLAFHIYEEGLAILSKYKLTNKKHFFISNLIDYHKWQTRIIVNAEAMIKGEVVSLTSAHIGWNDETEKYEDQIDKLFNQLDMNKRNVIGGDFNVPSGSKEYDYIINKGVEDLYYSGDSKYFTDPTHVTDLDIQSGDNRIDFVFSSKPYKVITRKTVFKDPYVSDHFGVYLELERNE